MADRLNCRQLAALPLRHHAGPGDGCPRLCAAWTGLRPSKPLDCSGFTCWVSRVRRRRVRRPACLTTWKTWNGSPTPVSGISAWCGAIHERQADPAGAFWQPCFSMRHSLRDDVAGRKAALKAEFPPHLRRRRVGHPRLRAAANRRRRAPSAHPERNISSANRRCCKPSPRARWSRKSRNSPPPSPELATASAEGGKVVIGPARFALADLRAAAAFAPAEVLEACWLASRASWRTGFAWSVPDPGRRIRLSARKRRRSHAAGRATQEWHADGRLRRSGHDRQRCAGRRLAARHPRPRAECRRRHPRQPGHLPGRSGLDLSGPERGSHVGGNRPAAVEQRQG